MQQTRSILLATATAAILAGGIGGFSSTASACNLEPSIGSICAYAFDWCPRGYIQTDGRQLAVAQYQALFSLIGYRYGGNSADMFAIPDLRGRAVYGKGLGPVLNDIVNIGQQFGQQWLMLSWNQVPLYPHTHTAVFGPTGGGTKEVTVPAVASTLGVEATLPLIATATGTATQTPAPVAGNTNYLGAVTAKVGLNSANFTGLFNNLSPAPAITATAPVTAKVTGSPGNPEIKFNVPVGITGGTVTVAPAQQPATMPVSVQSPGLGQTYCIASSGLYPDRP